MFSVQLSMERRPVTAEAIEVVAYEADFEEEGDEVVFGSVCGAEQGAVMEEPPAAEEEEAAAWPR